MLRQIAPAEATFFWPRAWSHHIYIALPCAIYRTCCFLKVCANCTVKWTFAFSSWLHNPSTICLVMCCRQRAALLKNASYLAFLPVFLGTDFRKHFQNLPSLDLSVWIISSPTTRLASSFLFHPLLYHFLSYLTPFYILLILHCPPLVLFIELPLQFVLQWQ